MDSGLEDMLQTAKTGSADSANAHAEDDNRNSLASRDQSAASKTNKLLEKLLEAINGQTTILAAVDGRLQRTHADSSDLIESAKSIQASLHKLVPQAENLCADESKRAEGKLWPGDEEHFKGRKRYYKRKWKDICTELTHLEIHYEKVGGDRGVINTSRAFRLALSNSVEPLTDVNGMPGEKMRVQLLIRLKNETDKAEGLRLEKSLQEKYRISSERCMTELTETAKLFHDSLYRQKHAFYFRKMGECCEFLEGTKLDYSQDNLHVPSGLDDVLHRLEDLFFEFVVELQLFREKALPVFLTEEKERIANRYLYITTIATFFSSVTATALAISLQSDNDASTYAVVNLFWFISLIFSVSSGVSSLLGMLWHNSRIFHLSPPPPEVRFWFERSPMVSLIIAALTFVVGLNVYVYVSAQAHFVSRMTSVFTGLHIMCLFSVVLWLVCQLYKKQGWARLLISITDKLRSWTKRFIKVISSNTFAERIKPVEAVYDRHFSLRRNINWALRLDSRVGLLNTLAVQNLDPGRPDCHRPHLAARVVRVMTLPLKFVKDFKLWIAFRKSRRQSVLSPIGTSSQMNPDLTGGIAYASEMPWMTGFRKVIERVFGSSTTSVMMAEIDLLQMDTDETLDEHRRERDLKLDALLWGYQELREKFNVTCLPKLHEYHIPELNAAFVLLSLQDILCTTTGHLSQVYKVQYNSKIYALKVLRATYRKNLNISRHYDIHVRKKIRHKNVIPVLGVYGIHDIQSPNRYLTLALPWFENGDLGTYIRANPPNDPTSLLLEVARGLQYLHNLQVIHGNLISSNILIDNRGHPRISGFGYAHILNLTSPLYRGGLIFSLRYTAPEVLMENDEEQVFEVKDLTEKFDIYAFACICLEVYTYEMPWREVNSSGSVMKKVCEGRRPNRPEAHGLTDDVWTLIERCWNQEPKAPRQSTK